MIKNIFCAFAWLAFNGQLTFSQTNKIDLNGPVGIGTLNPLHPLEIADNSSGNLLRIAINSTASDNAYIGYQFSKGTDFKGGMFRNKSTDDISFWTGYDGTNATITMLKQNNYVGIGTSTPSARLEVFDNDGLEQVRAIGAGGRSGFYAQTTNAFGQSNLIVASERDLSSYGAFAVGGAQNQFASLFGWSRGDRVFLVADGDYNQGMAIGTLRSQPLILGTNNEERVRIDVNGNLSIGSINSHGYKLAVNGSAIFTKVVVKTFGSWPDYVFDQRYPLMDLDKLEKFVRTFKHLPEIPSAKKSEETGVDLADNQVLLLKKIEELTLYVIDLNKKNEQQQKQLDLLNKKMNIAKRRSH